MVHDFSTEESFIQFVLQEAQTLDGLILEESEVARHALSDLHKNHVLLPCVVITDAPTKGTENSEDIGSIDDAIDQPQSLTSDQSASLAYPLQVNTSGLNVYHDATQQISKQEVENGQALQACVEKSIHMFLQLSPQSPLLAENRLFSDPELSQDIFTSLNNKQRRLSVKLQERLGYLGVYYKRNPDSFLRRMNSEENQAFLDNLRKDYRDIILNYFSDDADLNQRIDQYVTTAFFTDVPTAQMVQIHMDLMDEFSKQLKLEGRNEEILLDYRLTLIDMLANLCELYRRSIPRL